MKTVFNVLYYALFGALLTGSYVSSDPAAMLIGALLAQLANLVVVPSGVLAFNPTKTVKQLKEERGQLMSELEGLADKDKLAKDEEKRWNELTRSIEKLDEDIVKRSKLEDLQKIEALSNGAKIGSDPAEKAQTKPSTSWRSNTGQEIPVYAPGENLLSEREEPQYHIGQIARMLMFGPQNADERRALGESLDSSGGYSVPEVLAKSFVDAFRTKSRVTQAGARTIALTSDNLNMVKIISEPTPAWRAEHGEVTEGQPVFGTIRWEPKSLALAVPVSWEVLQDSVNLEDMLRRSLTESMANEIDRVALFGSGSANEPLGVANTAGIGVVSMGTNGGAIGNYSPILQAYGELLNSNVSSQRIAAIMNPREYVAFAELTATDNQPLMRPDLIKDVRFLETSKVPTNQTQGTANNAASIVMGDFSDLVYGLRQGIRLEFIKNGYWKKMEAVFLIHARVDVAVLREESFVALKGIIPA